MYRKEVRPFTDRQIVLVQGFAAQAEIAMTNARLFEAERQRSRELSEIVGAADRYVGGARGRLQVSRRS